MGRLSLDTLKDSIEVFLQYDENKDKLAREKETVVNELTRETTRYLALLSRKSLPVDEYNSITYLISAINDMERVGDHAMNILELGEFRNDHRLPFSDQAVNELIQMASKVQDTFDMAIFTFLHWDEETAKKILLIEEEIDNMEKHCDSII